MPKVLKWAGVAVGALLALLLVAGSALYVVGGNKVDRTYDVQTAALTVPSDSATVARGAHVAAINGCRDCHGADLSGQVFADAPPFRVVASNLTSGRGGIGAAYSDADWDRAIRHGVKPDGRPVYIMPSAAFHQLSDADAAALIAYLKTVPPVDHELPATEVRPLGRVLSAVVFDPAFEVRTAAARSHAPEPGPTAEYGAYLAGITCTYCHGGDLQGMERPPNPESPPTPSLAAAGQWPLDVFMETLRTGVTPDGRQMDPKFMPWSFTASMTDTELEALHAHLAALSAGLSTQTASVEG